MITITILINSIIVSLPLFVYFYWIAWSFAYLDYLKTFFAFNFLYYILIIGVAFDIGVDKLIQTNVTTFVDNYNTGSNLFIPFVNGFGVYEYILVSVYVFVLLSHLFVIADEKISDFTDKKDSILKLRALGIETNNEGRPINQLERDELHHLLINKYKE